MYLIKLHFCEYIISKNFIRNQWREVQENKDVDELRKDKRLNNNNQLEEEMEKYVSEKASSRFSTNLESRGPTQKSTW